MFLQVMEPSIIICESFQNRSQEAASLAPLEYIGVVRDYGQETGTPVVWQSASTGKAFWSDDKLLKVGLYIRGLRHARDAIRHYAYWQSFKQGDKSRLNLLNSKTPQPSTVKPLPPAPSLLG